jgi:hypothetical protein
MCPVSTVAVCKPWRITQDVLLSISAAVLMLPLLLSLRWWTSLLLPTATAMPVDVMPCHAAHL